MHDASSWTPTCTARSMLGAKTQKPNDWFVEVFGELPFGTAKIVFSHHSFSASASVLTSSDSVLPSLRSTLRSATDASLPTLNSWASKAAFTPCAVSPVEGSNSTSEAEVQSSPLFAIAAQAVPAAAAGCVADTPSSRTLLRPLTSPAYSSRKFPSSYAFLTRALNIADEPVNCSLSTRRSTSCSTSGSASGVTPGTTSKSPAGRPHSARSRCTSWKCGKKRGCTTSSTR
mmetsp:Transcript_37067/g.96677  ORF Transcript_37067/g.96677 Transcript_37067/m.96677 type:complete len:230 (+) Transcript_37067:694-1383(+)